MTPSERMNTIAKWIGTKACNISPQALKKFTPDRLEICVRAYWGWQVSGWAVSGLAIKIKSKYNSLKEMNNILIFCGVPDVEP